VLTAVLGRGERALWSFSRFRRQYAFSSPLREFGLCGAELSGRLSSRDSRNKVSEPSLLGLGETAIGPSFSFLRYPCAEGDDESRRTRVLRRAFIHKKLSFRQPSEGSSSLGARHPSRICRNRSLINADIGVVAREPGATRVDVLGRNRYSSSGTNARRTERRRAARGRVAAAERETR